MIRGCLIATPIAALMWVGIFWAGSHAIVIFNDGGGKVVDYLIRNMSNERIQIMGKCYSACTLGLKHENVCIGPKARLFFHAPRTKDGKITPEATRWFKKLYPNWVQNWIEVNGGLKPDFVEMPREYAARFVKSC
jgi:hypothetical protein